MDFGKAIVSLKEGKRVCRSGWNGKGMFLAYQKGYPEGVKANKNSQEAYGVNEGDVIRVLPYIAMKTVDNCFVPWLASQTDMLAEDWEVAAE